MDNVGKEIESIKKRLEANNKRFKKLQAAIKKSKTQRPQRKKPKSK